MRILHFFAVLLLPLAAVGLNVVKSNAQTQIANGLVRALVVIGLFLVVWGIVVLSSFLHHVVVNVVTFISLATAVTSAGTAVELEYLQQRGRTTSCAVLKVDKRVESDVTYNGDGTRTTNTSIHYDHELDCVDGGRIELSLRHEIAPRGHRLDLTFDPDHRLDPVPATDVEERDTERSRAVFFLVLTLLVRLADSLVTAFSPSASSARPLFPAAPARRTAPRHAATPPERRPTCRERAAHRRADRR